MALLSTNIFIYVKKANHKIRDFTHAISRYVAGVVYYYTFWHPPPGQKAVLSAGTQF